MACPRREKSRKCSKRERNSLFQDSWREGGEGGRERGREGEGREREGEREGRERGRGEGERGREKGRFHLEIKVRLPYSEEVLE